ncbi:MAG: MBL fold metallo-hydrolase [Tumebacillaceae bacterium]
MTWLLWIVGALLALVLLLAGWFLLMYSRHRKEVPQPPYKNAAGKPSPHLWSKDEVTVAWVGHSTLLIHFFGVKILTDPVFAEKVGVKIAGPWIVGPKRHTAPALTLDEIGEVDVILLSHAHLDHFDLPTLKRLSNPRTEVVTASNTGRLLRRFAFGRVHELGGQERITLGSGVTITAVPVRHWGRRFPWNSDYGWNGYLIEHHGVRMFFAGDTAYTPTFQALREEGEILVAFLPIGAYSPDSYQGAHCTPEQAWQMFLDSGAKWLVPIHWDTFVLSQEPVREPIERLLAAAGDETERIVIREHGDEFKLPVVAKHHS